METPSFLPTATGNNEHAILGRKLKHKEKKLNRYFPGDPTSTAHTLLTAKDYCVWHLGPQLFPGAGYVKLVLSHQMIQGLGPTQWSCHAKVSVPKDFRDCKDCSLSVCVGVCIPQVLVWANRFPCEHPQS